MHSEKNSKAIIVAGAGKGIGYAVVCSLLKNNPELAVLAISKNTVQLNALQKHHSRLNVISCDLSSLTVHNKSEISAFLKGKKLTGLIFTAGMLRKEKINSVSLSLFNDIYKNNVWAFIDLIQTVHSFIDSDTHIVSLGSMGGVSGTLKFEGMSVYSSSKAALSIYTECLAEELKVIGASANCLAISAVNTEMMKEAFPEYTSLVNPGDIAPFIIEFVLKAKNLFNGKTIPVSSSTP